MKTVYEIERDDGVIHFDLDNDRYPILFGIEVYVPFIDDWIEIEAGDLSLRQINKFTKEVIEHINTWEREKEYDPEHDIF